MLYDPIITSLPKYAHFFSIIGFEEWYVLWVAKHYLLYHAYSYKTHKGIDLSGFDKESFDNNPYPNGPCIESFKVPLFEETKAKITDYIIDSINRGFFVCINIRTVMVKEYLGCDLIHPILISGYDLKHNYFIVSDFFPPTSVYRKENIDINELIESIELSKYPFYILYKRVDGAEFDLKNEIGLLKKVLIDSLQRINGGKVTAYNPYYFKNKILYDFSGGIDTYNCLIDDIISYGKKGLHIMTDQKILLKECLIPLVKYSDLPNELIEHIDYIIDRLTIEKNKYIKYTIKMDERILESIKSELKQIKAFEFELNKMIIEHLRK